ncbi:MAG: protein phosphatase 2C domain-containing protein [Lachnospiraceae bacterium]|nr:protein phosphatase 2C domain-containing protein [Lachnospiraceae bacterium]
MRDRLFAISQTGVSHLTADTRRPFAPCQDAYKIYEFSEDDILEYKGNLKGTIIAVADGHGNPIFHGSSEFGARLAVEAAVECMMDLVNEYEKTPDPIIFKCFPKTVVTVWRDWVIEHALNRFPEQDLKKRFKNTQAFTEYCQRILMDYGSTLLTVLVIPEKNLLVAAQIGDGDLLIMHHSEQEPNVHRLIRGNPDEEFGSNRTESMCMHDAEEKFQVLIMDGERDEEVKKQLKDFVLMAATDGISSGALSENHFLNDFCRVWMKAYMNSENETERKSVQNLMEDRMENEIRYYSPDDMTLVLFAVNDRD